MNRPASLPSRQMLKHLFARLFVYAAFGLLVLSARAEDRKLVRVGFQKSGALLLVKQEGAFERTLAPLGYSVEWKEFPAGPPLLEALNGGSIDFGHSGDAPLVFAQSSGVEFEYIGASESSPASAAIVVPKTSGLKGVAELKGRRVAFAKGSSAHYLLAKALEANGLSISDIKPIYLQPPNARAAFQSGAIDAWAIWDPFLAAAELDAEAKILVSAEGLSPHREFYFGSKSFLKANGKAISPILAAINESATRALKDPHATAVFLAEKLGLPEPILERAEARKKRYGANPLSAKIIAEQQSVADLFLAQGLILSPIRVEHAILSAGGRRHFQINDCENSLVFSFAR